MPAARAASSREAPSSTRARASIRREAAVSRHRLASRRSSTAPSSFRVIATVMAPPPIGHTADQPRQTARGSGRDDASAIRAVGITNAFSKKVENLKAAVALHFAHYNFVRVHSTLRMTPAMASGVTPSLWTLGDLMEEISN